MELSPDVLEDLLSYTRDPLLDQRKHLRTAMRATAYTNLTGDGGGVQVGVRDLSAGGMGVTIARPVSVGQQFVVSLERGNGPPLLLLCEVRHCEPLGSGIYKAGLRFVDTSDAGPLAS